MPHGFTLVGDVERQESDALQCLQHFGDVAAFFGVGHQFAPDQAGMSPKIAFIVGIIEQSDGKQPGFRRQAQRDQAQAAEGGEQAAQGKQGGKVGVHVFGFWLRSASAGAGGVAIPARYDGAGVKSKDEAGFGLKGFRRLCCEPFFL